MIRIDLAKDELEKNAPHAEKPSLFQGIRLPSFLKNISPTVNVTAVIIVVVAMAFSVLPHLFFLQYKTYVETEHQVRLKTIRIKMGKINMEISKLSSLQSELQSYEQQKKTVSEKLASVKELLAARGTPVNVLDTLGQSLPRRTWLTSIEMILSAEGSVKLLGHSYSNEEISDYIDKLAESVYLADTRLESVTSEIKDKVTTKTFSISAKPKTQFKGPEGAL